MSTQTEARKITGAEAVAVFVEQKIGTKTHRFSVTLRRGETLPDNLADGEIERIEAMGAFKETTHAQDRLEYQRRVREAQRNAASVAAAATDARLVTDATPNRNTGPGVPPPPLDPNAVQTPTGEFVTPAGITSDTSGSPEQRSASTADPLMDPVAYLESLPNVDMTVAFIQSRPANELALWLEAEKMGKARSTVLKHDFTAEPAGDASTSDTPQEPAPGDPPPPTS